MKDRGLLHNSLLREKKTEPSSCRKSNRYSSAWRGRTVPSGRGGAQEGVHETHLSLNTTSM